MNAGGAPDDGSRLKFLFSFCEKKTPSPLIINY